jgi:hypothetical protein
MSPEDIFAPWIDERSAQQREIDRAITMLGRRRSSLPALVRSEAGSKSSLASSARVVIEVLDGRYRVKGHEWLLTFKKRRSCAAIVCQTVTFSVASSSSTRTSSVSTIFANPG